MSPQRKGRKIAHKLNWNRDRIQDRAMAEDRREILNAIFEAKMKALKAIGNRMTQVFAEWITSPEGDAAMHRLAQKHASAK